MFIHVSDKLQNHGRKKNQMLYWISFLFCLCSSLCTIHPHLGKERLPFLYNLEKDHSAKHDGLTLLTLNRNQDSVIGWIQLHVRLRITALVSVKDKVWYTYHLPRLTLVSYKSSLSTALSCFSSSLNRCIHSPSLVLAREHSAATLWRSNRV